MTTARPADSAAAKGWLAENWLVHFRRALESMCGENTDGRIVPAPGPPSAGERLTWRQPFSIGSDCTFIASAAQSAVKAVGLLVLAAAGMENPSDEDISATYLEILQQAMSGLASEICALLGREVNCLPGKPTDAQEQFSHSANISAGSASAIAIELAASPALIEALLPTVSKPAVESSADSLKNRPDSLPVPADAPVSQTIEILYDVELPVSVSFGRAHLPLREVLKLTTGTIVELNRTINEPVEIIVNNCVIARGEVVVVEGNYGVRIQKILSQGERLRSLH